MAVPGDQKLEQLIADLSGAAGHRGLQRTLAMLKAPRPKSSFGHVCELQALAGDVVDRLERADAARAAERIEVAEDSFADAIDLMVELKFRSAAQPGHSHLGRSARSRVTLV
ncbi:MAG: hypothetical protein AAGF81_17070 [Pseudomonadota bacterium]